jgi:acetyl-CoA carboxylase biotin carboxyl carrier protein
MEEHNIRKYAKLMQELGLTGLEISENGCAVRLERTEQDTKPVQSEKSAQSAPTATDDFINICSPMVGVFYCSPAEDAAPFIKVGDTIQKGDVLCIIEAMKLMNEITAEQDGVVAEVCVGNNQMVDFGHVLFRLKKERP